MPTKFSCKLLASKSSIMIGNLLVNCVMLALFSSPAAAQQGIFTDVTAEIGVDLFRTRSATFGDFDNDGRPDLYLTESWNDDGGSVLLHNDGDGSFSDQTSMIQADLSGIVKGSGSGFADYDNDGDLDLHVALGAFFDHERHRNLLLRNDRDRFVEVGLESGLTDVQPTDGALWLDYDRDGHLDVYSVNVAVIPEPGKSLQEASFDPTARNRLYRNQGDGTYVDVTAVTGLDLQFAPFGGSLGGLSAADFNADGWPDLFLGVFNFPNRFFLSDGQGGFLDATTDEIADPGPVFGVAVGDTDNDGDLDLFMASGGLSDIEQTRSQLLLYVGDTFLDVLDGVGLGSLRENLHTAALFDVDNDGDLDLLGSPLQLFLNDGEGQFSDETELLGIGDQGDRNQVVVVGDYNGDGFLDLLSKGLYRNNGNDNHWLRVELAGTASNRNGVGSQLVATTGDRQQIREIFGGDGINQREMLAHFGLGEQSQVDRLEIRWPSGQVDVLTDIPADQKIRVVEGRGEWYPAERTVWAVEPPVSIPNGEVVDLVAVARPALFEPDATITAVTADLSQLGGSEATPLEDMGDGTYRLEASFTASGDGSSRVSVLFEQATSLGAYWISLSHSIEVRAPITAVLETRNEAVPEVFELGQNHPNPFNSGTVIRFDLPADGEIDLMVYNLMGQKVDTLIDGSRQAGSYTLHWDGRDGDGLELASGVYVYRLRSGGQFVQTRRMALVR